MKVGINNPAKILMSRPFHARVAPLAQSVSHHSSNPWISGSADLFSLERSFPSVLSSSYKQADV